MIDIKEMRKGWQKVDFLPEVDIANITQEELSVLDELFNECEVEDLVKSIVLYRVAERNATMRYTGNDLKQKLATYIMNTNSEVLYFGEAGFANYTGVSLYLRGDIVTRMMFAQLGV